MNPAPGQPQQPGTGQGQPGPAGQQPAMRPPMYQPQQIRGLPMLSEEEKSKYEHGLKGLWLKANNSPTNSPEQLAARQKIMEFSRMLFSKIHQRRVQFQQQQQQQDQQQQQQAQQPQQNQSAQQPQQPQPHPQTQQAQRPQPGQSAQQPQPMQKTQAAQKQQQQQQQQQQGAQNAQMASRPQPGQQNPQASGQPQNQLQKQLGNTSTNQADSNAAGGSTAQPSNQQAPTAAAAAAQRPKIPDVILQHAKQILFRPPPQIAEKSPAEIAKWTEEMRDRYSRALWTMENNKAKLAGMEKVIKEKSAAGRPLTDEELRQFQMRKEQTLKMYSDAKKWVESVRKQHDGVVNQQGSSSGTAGPVKPADTAQAANITNVAQNKQPQAAAAAAAAAATSANSAAEGAKNQQQAAASNRASPGGGPTTSGAPSQTRPAPNASQPAAQQAQVQAQAQAQAQGQAHKQEQARPAPVNTALASSMAQTLLQAAGSANAGPGSARVQTPQSSTSVNHAAGATVALSHSAALSRANQRAAGTPGSAPTQMPPTGGNTPSSATALNPGIMQQQQQQGHPHAHPTQQQQHPQSATQSSGAVPSKMPIPKQLPEKATAVPQGVPIGGGVAPGRPTISQGTGTLGGVMNQPSMTRIPAYNHEAEGDRVLSKKKLDELVRQVCGESAEGQEGNMLSPEVEENVLSMADAFVDHVVHAAARNCKERGSKVLEIRDLQLVLERTYNIRVPGYSSDELRTVRKVHPSAGWIAKMSAVQAAKVMPGKGDL